MSFGTSLIRLIAILFIANYGLVKILRVFNVNCRMECEKNIAKNSLANFWKFLNDFIHRRSVNKVCHALGGHKM